MERKDRDTARDFEDTNGRCGSENETDGTIDQSNTDARRHGEYGCKITFDGGGLELYAADTDGTSRGELYWRFYFQFDSNIGSLDVDALYCIGVWLDATYTHSVIYYYFTDDTNGNPAFWYCADSAGLACYDLASAMISGDTWYLLELYWLKGASGKLEGKVDGAEFDNQGSGDNSSMADVGAIFYIGSLDLDQTNSPANGEYYYYDDWIIDDAGWIGEYAIPWNRRRMS